MANIENLGVIVAIAVNTIFTLYLVPILLALFIPHKYSASAKVSNAPKFFSFAVVIPLYKEKYSNLEATVNSIIAQKYPKNKIKVYFVLEKEDKETYEAVKRGAEVLKENNISFLILVRNDKRRLGKADALNYALKHVNEDIFLVFDADNIVPNIYLEDLNAVFHKGYDATFAKVYRHNNSFHGKLLSLDTVLWYDIILYSLKKIAKGYVQLSGEGLAVKTEVLKKINGFPRVLTEDAMLALLLAKHNFKILYNGISIHEKAPRTLISHLKQRIRWFQGYYQCLKELFKNILKTNLKVFSGLLLAYMAPIAALATMISHSILITYWVSRILNIQTIAEIILSIYGGLIFYWSLGLLVLGNLFLILMFLYMLSDTPKETYAPYVFIMPLYWYLNGILALAALFLPRTWRKTER